MPDSVRGLRKNALFLLRRNPRLLFGFLRSGLGYKLLSSFLPRVPLQGKIGKIAFEFDFSLDDNIKAMYFDFYEPETLYVFRRFLRPGDVFIDAGASIGYLSALGASLVGKTGQVHSFEPVPQYFQRLKGLKRLNPEYNISLNPCALAEKEAQTRISISRSGNIGWNTMVPGFMDPRDIREQMQIRTIRLDAYIKQKQLSRIALIKIDVEGFEFQVLKGLGNYLQDAACRPVIICEICPDSIYALLGQRRKQLIEYMQKYGYCAYSPFAPNQRIDISRLKETAIVVFRPD